MPTSVQNEPGPLTVAVPVLPGWEPIVAPYDVCAPAPFRMLKVPVPLLPILYSPATERAASAPFKVSVPLPEAASPSVTSLTNTVAFVTVTEPVAVEPTIRSSLNGMTNGGTVTD